MRKPVFGISNQVIQTGLYIRRRQLEVLNFRFRKERDCTIYVAKTKALISCAVSAQLICVFVFAYANVGFSQDRAEMLFWSIFLYLDLIHTRQCIHCLLVRK